MCDILTTVDFDLHSYALLNCKIVAPWFFFKTKTLCSCLVDLHNILFFQASRRTRRLRPTSRPSLRRRTRAPQRKSTVIRHAPPTLTTSSSCLTQSLTSSLQITFEGAGCIRGGSCVVLQLTGSAVNLKQNSKGHDVTLKLSFYRGCRSCAARKCGGSMLYFFCCLYTE